MFADISLMNGICTNKGCQQKNTNEFKPREKNLTDQYINFIHFFLSHSSYQQNI